MRMAYQKGAARSEEQAFNPHVRQPMLMPDIKNSLIEEEIKSNSNLNLSTSSRSYRPGAIKPKSTIYSHHSAAMSVSSNSNYQTPQFTNPNIPAPNSTPQYFYSNPPNNNLPMHTSNMIPTYTKPIPIPITEMHKPFPVQYNYPVNMVPPQSVYPPTQLQGQPPAPTFTPTTLPPSNPTPIYTKPTITNDKPLEPPHTEIKIANSTQVPKAINSTASSSNLSPRSVSPSAGELRVGTGMLKFFNQQHQYGFIIS
mmetsp:Transcript_5295/g.6061  ORF Transcript_5295/g.6061 Transcript_5295/m.6061 type:complete len:254 (+) Transcript_5295:511-1272(+)